MPLYIRDEQQATKVFQAIGKYLEIKKTLPSEWTEEHNGLTNAVQKRLEEMEKVKKK